MMPIFHLTVKKVAPVVLLIFPLTFSECPLLDLFGGTDPLPVNANPWWDTDGDSISNAVELNDANDFQNFDTAQYDYNPSIARGLPNNGWIDCALNLVNSGTGYYHNVGPDAIDTDDWAVLAMIYMIEAAGREWYGLGKVPPRIVINDLSRGDAHTQSFGGAFPPHDSHQNGLDVDIRYVRNDGQEIGLNIADDKQRQYYDAANTVVLLNRLRKYGRVTIIYMDTVHAGITVRDPIRYWDGHEDHFHVRIEDPDGTDNKIMGGGK